MVTHDPSTEADPHGHGHRHGVSDSDPRVEKWEQRFFWPVLVAALASVPAVFLTIQFDPPWEVAGEVINHISMVVFAAETVVLLALARDKRQWVRDHWGIVAVTALTIPAVLLALGPAQVLRVVARGVRTLGALRIIRVGRIFKAGKILYNRTDFSGPVRKGMAIGATLLAAAFVALVLADPSTKSREFLDQNVPGLFGGVWPYLVVAAGLILAGATFVVFRVRREADAPSDSEPRRDHAEPAGSDE